MLKFLKSKLFWILIFILAIGLFGWLWFKIKDSNNPASINNNQSALLAPQSNPNPDILPDAAVATNDLSKTDSLAISDQYLSDSVTIDNYYLSKPGFIIIHETKADGGEGPMVGKSGFLQAGKGQDLEITAKLTAGKTYLAIIHQDNGDKIFNSAQDAVIFTTNNSSLKTFKIFSE